MGNEKKQKCLQSIPKAASKMTTFSQQKHAIIEKSSAYLSVLSGAAQEMSKLKNAKHQQVILSKPVMLALKMEVLRREEENIQQHFVRESKKHVIAEIPCVVNTLQRAKREEAKKHSLVLEEIPIGVKDMMSLREK